jgi:antitoxin component YwqK of YwqJK toxin-antitoxin module
VYQHGEKCAEVPYTYGFKHGVEKRYRDGQIVTQEVSWESGQQHGPTTTYAGDVSKTAWYYRDNEVTKTNYDYMTTRPVVR